MAWFTSVTVSGREGNPAGVRDFIRREHTGFIAEGSICVEPGCSCQGGVSGPFREKPARCTSFEELVLPLTADDCYDAETFKRFGDCRTPIGRSCGPASE